MLGSGRAHVAQVCDLARANLKDGLPGEAVASFASLGAHGQHSANQERDLHRWLGSLYGMNLTTYKVAMRVNVSCSHSCRSTCSL